MRTKWISILLLGLVGFMEITAEKSMKEIAYEYYSSISPGFKKYEEKLSPEKFDNFQMKEMTDEGMKYLIIFPNLEYFDAGDSKISDDSLKIIPSLPKLHHLYLQRTKITNKGIEHISKSKTITALFLEEISTGIDDGCIPHLLKMKQLTQLGITGTGITLQGLKKLRKGLPKAHVEMITE